MANRFDIEKERETLIKAQGGDLSARKEIHDMYKPLLDSIVYREHKNSPQPLSAVRAEAERLLDVYYPAWDPSMPNKPSTFLHANISKKLKRYVSEHANPVLGTEKYRFKIHDYRTSVSELTQNVGRKPTNFEVQQHMNQKFPGYNLSLKDVERLKRDTRTTVFSTSQIGSQEEGTQLTAGDLAFVSQEEDPLEVYRRESLIQEVMDKADKFSEPQRTILYHYYGLKGYQRLSLRELSAKLGINKYRIQVYLREAEDKLKNGPLF